MNNKTKVILHIDTSRQTGSILSLTIAEKSIKKNINGPASAQKVLSFLDSILKNQKITVEDINEISLYTGPGSFTGLRIGAATAQTLGLLLGIQVNNRKIGESLELRYQ